MRDPTADAYRPSGGRPLIRTADLRALQRASASIIELGAELDDRLSREARPHERLRLLRETTYRIVRTANDAVRAYQRASRSLAAALERPNADEATAALVRAHLDAARAELLQVLDVAGRRYPAGEAAQVAGPPSAERTTQPRHGGDT